MQEIQEERTLEENNSNTVFSTSQYQCTEEWRRRQSFLSNYVSSVTNDNNVSQTNLVLITEEDCEPGMPRVSPKYIKLKNLG